MKSRALVKFWDAYGSLDEAEKILARKAYNVWRVNPYHPSLAFKKVGKASPIWSARISKSTRALCLVKEGTAHWFWIGPHDEYEMIIRGK